MLNEIAWMFTAYLVVILLIAYVAYRQTLNFSDYILGGRRLSGTVAAMGAGASDMSGWLMLALPGAFYLAGGNQIWLPLGLIVGAYINWQVIAKRLRVYTEVANDSLTIPSYFENRFHDTTSLLRTITALAILFFFTVYAAAGFAGGALLLQSAFGFLYLPALFISAVILIGYTAFGGFLAVNWVDLLQGGLMLIALLTIPLVATSYLGGWNEVTMTLATVSPDYLNIFSDLDFIMIISLLGWGLGYFGQPHILVRFMAVTSIKEIPKAKAICMSWMILCLIGSATVGLVGHALFIDTPLAKPESVFLETSKLLFNPWITGILFAAVISAIMSTIAAQLIASSSALADDLYKALFRQQASQKELIWMGRFGVIIVTLIAIWLASDPDNKILTIVAYAWAGLGAAFGPTLLCSLFWQRMTRLGAFWGILVGAMTVVIWESMQYFAVSPIFELYSIIPGFILSCVAIVVASLMGSKPSEAIQLQLVEYEKKLKK